MTYDVFLHGALCHSPLLDIILGFPATVAPAQLSGHRVFWADRALPDLRPSAGGGGEVTGKVLRGVDAEALKRLTYFHACFGQIAGDVHIRQADQDLHAIAFFGPEGAEAAHPTDGGEDWYDRFAATITATAYEIMRGYNATPAKLYLSRQGPLLARGASRARAQSASPPNTLRHRPLEGDVVVAAIDTPYAHFFSVEEYDLQFRRFDGNLSPSILRAAFVMADAVTVLPYDPHRDRVLVIEQFRAGPLARGDRQTWSIEAIAGRIDAGETPQAAARREAEEEAGLTLTELLDVAQYYPSPGAVSEYLYSYVALTDLPDGVAGVFGVAEEAENIRGHLISFDHLMTLVDSGEVSNAPLILTALWLARERPRLRPHLRGAAV